MSERQDIFIFEMRLIISKLHSRNVFARLPLSLGHDTSPKQWAEKKEEQGAGQEESFLCYLYTAFTPRPVACSNSDAITFYICFILCAAQEQSRAEQLLCIIVIQLAGL